MYGQSDAAKAAAAKARTALNRSNVSPILVAIVLLIIAVCMTWAGGFLLYQRQTAARTTAKVDSCDVQWSGTSRYVYCTGSWMVGGTSVADGGNIVVGSVEGADTDDIGKTIDVTLSRDGQTAYTRDPKLGIAILVTGLLTAAGFVWWVRLMLRARKAPAA